MGEHHSYCLTWSEVGWFGSKLQEWLCWFSEGEGRAIITLTGPEGKWFAVGLGTEPPCTTNYYKKMLILSSQSFLTWN
jgi:hypothetical protein